MSDTSARIGYLTTYAIEDAAGSGVYVALDEIFSVTPPSFSSETVDATHMSSANRAREFITGLTDFGSASVEMNYIPNNATEQRILALRASGEKLSHRITYPNGVTVSFKAQVEGWEPSVPLEDRMTATLTVKVSGIPVMAVGSAPVIPT